MLQNKHDSHHDGQTAKLYLAKPQNWFELSKWSLGEKNLLAPWMVSLVWKTSKGFSLAIAMIACNTYRLIVLITYSSSMLACFALQKKFTAFFVHYACVYCSDDHCLFTSEKVVTTGWNLTIDWWLYGPAYRKFDTLGLLWTLGYSVRVRVN